METISTDISYALVRFHLVVTCIQSQLPCIQGFLSVWLVREKHFRCCLINCPKQCIWYQNFSLWVRSVPIMPINLAKLGSTLHFSTQLVYMLYVYGRLGCLCCLYTSICLSEYISRPWTTKSFMRPWIGFLLIGPLCRRRSLQLQRAYQLLPFINNACVGH